MKMTVVMSYENYSDAALDIIVKTCVGKPALDKTLNSPYVEGIILSGKRIEGTKNVEYEIEYRPWEDFETKISEDCPATYSIHGSFITCGNDTDGDYNSIWHYWQQEKVKRLKGVVFK